MEPSSSSTLEEKTELEEQFILRLPPDEAALVRNTLQTTPEKLKRMLKITLDPDRGIGNVSVKKTKLHAYLHKLPTIVESYKTNICNDKATMFKTADICHVLDCHYEELAKYKRESNNGYAAPLKNAKKRRFRKALVNPEMAEETEMVSRELYYLLSTDLEAISTKFEIIYEGMKDNLPQNKDSSCENQTQLFGDVSSLSSDSEEIIVV